MSHPICLLHDGAKSARDFNVSFEVGVEKSELLGNALRDSSVLQHAAHEVRVEPIK